MRGCSLFAFVLLALPAAAAAAAEPATVKVFILAGQSNMEGKAPNKLLDHQATDPATKEMFAHLRKDDQWIVRDDVFIKFLNRKGGLTVGFGSPDRTGPELEFGTVMGDHFAEPVLLIKTAWGGHSLYQKFRSPSAGLPSDAALQAELERMQKQVRTNNEKNKNKAPQPLPTLDDVKAGYGTSYREMLNEVRSTLADLDAHFPELKGRKPELAGFVWFQGWNDQYNGAETEYAANMAHFIRDVRQDFAAPRMPFVIAAMGQNGSKPAQGAMLAVRDAQLSMNDVAEFRGTVRAFRTDLLVDRRAEELFPEWKERRAEWDRVGGDFPYHYLGSAIWFNRIGRAMGEAMLELLKTSAK